MENPFLKFIFFCLFLGIIFCLGFGYLVEVNKLKFKEVNNPKSENQIWLPQLP